MFGPFNCFNRQSPFQKGDLKYVLLDLIKEKPRHGYDIIRALEEQSRGMYAPSAGVVYPTLQMLEEMGYTKSDQLDGKKVYSITEEGLQ
jgi:DNA-binding PadR family transcriptional regulator